MSSPRDRSIVKQFAELERATQEIKSVQFMGKRAITNYRTYSNNPYDFHTLMVLVNDTRYFRITFNYNTSTKGALIRLRIFYSIDPDVMGNAIPYVTPTAPAIEVRWRKEVPMENNRATWVARIVKNHFGVPSYDAYLKFFFDGTDSGNWSIVEI